MTVLGMRPLLVLVLLGGVAHAQPADDWRDVPALIASATAAHDDALRGCFSEPLPQSIALIANRDRGGKTSVGMPFPAVGYRGFTPEERCLMKAVAAIELPPLPPSLERVIAVHTVTAAGAPAPAVEAAFADWRDPAATLAGALDDRRRAALTACDRRARTIRLVIDLRHQRTRVWMPAWQFHAPSGDGSTPPAQRTIKRCLTRALRGWQLPVLPRALPELQATITTAP